MRLFLDSSVLLSAAGSSRGASREVFRLAPHTSWQLIATPYAIDEVHANLAQLSSRAATDWAQLQDQLLILNDVFALDRITVFEPAKDRPILFSALAWSEVLLTLDREDFGTMLGQSFYGLLIQTPGKFLGDQRAEGKLPTL